MRRAASILMLSLALAGCGGPEEPAAVNPMAEAFGRAVAPAPSTPRAGPASGPARAKPSLVEARRGFRTKLAGPRAPAEPVPRPPQEVFRLVRYDAPAGKLAAYLTPDPGDGGKHPAIVWITGGGCNSIGDIWSEAPRANDQTAAAFRRAGIVMMFPSLRGGNDNPGRREGFLGEVDDVLAAVEFLGRQSYVDPGRIYLGGHSTGGTLVMLVAECTDRLRAVFSFGPADDVRGYPGQYLPFDTSDPKEFELRSPGRWLDSVRCPLFVFEGAAPSGNIPSLRKMAAASTNPLIRFFPVPGLNHFSVLAPANDLIAARILDDDGPTTRIAFSQEELDRIAGR